MSWWRQIPCLMGFHPRVWDAHPKYHRQGLIQCPRCGLLVIPGSAMYQIAGSPEIRVPRARIRTSSISRTVARIRAALARRGEQPYRKAP